MHLETTRLILRPLSLRDEPAIQRHFADWEIVRYMTRAVPWPYPPDGARYFLAHVALPAMARGDEWLWAIVPKNALTDELVGVIHLRRDDVGPGHRGFWMATDHQRNGYMTEAVEAVNRFAFETMGFARLIVKNAAGNEGSRRVKQRTGAVLLHTADNTSYHGGQTREEVWEITADAWRRAHGR